MSPNFDALTDCLEISSATPVQDIATEFVYFIHGQTTLEKCSFPTFFSRCFLLRSTAFFFYRENVKTNFHGLFSLKLKDNKSCIF